MKVQKIISICTLGAVGTALIVLKIAGQNIRYNSSAAGILAMPISEEWSVISVHDGDTIKVEKNGSIERIRLCGIDAPETLQNLGKDSRNYLQSLIPVGKSVQISIVGTDRYSRKIGEIFLGEKFINEEMTKSGMAYSYDRYKNCPNQIAIGNGEAIAQSKKLGVWGGEYQKPWDYRKAKRSK